MLIVTALSATLNTGQILKSMKSTTAPYNSLSIKFPIVPPSNNPIENCNFSGLIIVLWKLLYSLFPVYPTKGDLPFSVNEYHYVLQLYY